MNNYKDDFIADRQLMGSVEVWNIDGKMCIALPDDPVYITKEQAMKFFDLEEKEPVTNLLEQATGCSMDRLDKLSIRGDS